MKVLKEGSEKKLVSLVVHFFPKIQEEGPEKADMPSCIFFAKVQKEGCEKADMSDMPSGIFLL